MTFALSDLVRGLVVLSVHPGRPRVAPGAAKAFGFSIPAGVPSIVDEVIESMTDGLTVPLSLLGRADEVME